ncbi:energy transducer TonB [Flavobacterium pallidum]|uniref:TonB C-terminal domain-containing protein n=1 Tax=Flavobacterium pallidum TaxID=2172098 RepID=A0A2S1SJH0_9FLAO|nr:energy transducer TonB [Flavobacterium pallidum]AWI26497.1 hypothetical protein HYN49_11640 [Flavobacterium pallidum]
MKTKFAMILMGLVTLCGSAQDKIYKDKKNKPTTPDLAESYEISTFSDDKIHQTIRTYRMDGSPISESGFMMLENGAMPEGKSTLYNPDGSVAWFASYNKGGLEGESKAFWPGGALKREEVFSENKLVTGKCYDKDGKEIPYFPREKRPEYPGGMREAYKFIGDNFHVKGNKSGTIFLTFVIASDGSVTEVEVKKGISKRLDNEAIRVLESMPKWIPGTQEGIAVKVSYSLPIKVAAQE